VFAVLGSLLLAAGCADVAGDALHQDVALLRQDVNTLKVSAQRVRGEADAIAQLDRRTRDQSAETNRQLGAMSTRLESISAELSRLSGRLDDVSRRLDTVSRQAAQSRAPAPTPGGPVAGTPAAPAVPPSPSARPVPPAPPASPSPPVVQAPPVVAPPTTPTPPSTAVVPPASPAVPPPPIPVVPAPTPRATPPSVSPPPSTAPVSPGPSTASPAPPLATVPPRATPPAAGRAPAMASAEEAYQAAYLDFSRGRYELAMSGFREFLRRYPDSPLADSAQYGIGESYYSMATAAATQGQADKATRALEQSVQEFRKVIVAYPRGAKVPPALYKEALALTELKQTSLARARLQYLVDNFPQSEEAPLAKERLATLKP
jgi:TolA-binding protein